MMMDWMMVGWMMVGWMMMGWMMGWMMDQGMGGGVYVIGRGGEVVLVGVVAADTRSLFLPFDTAPTAARALSDMANLAGPVRVCLVLSFTLLAPPRSDVVALVPVPVCVCVVGLRCCGEAASYVVK
jgi:hypothetical protein